MSIIMAHRFNAIQFNSIKRRKTTKLGRGGGHPRLGVAGRFYSQTRLGSKQLFKQLFKQFKTEFNDLVRALLETNQATVSLISLLSLSHVLVSLSTLKIEALPAHPVFSQR